MLKKFLSVWFCVLVTSLLIGCQGNETISSLVDNGADIFGKVGRIVDLPVSDLRQVENVTDVVGDIPGADDASLIQSISSRSGIVNDPSAAAAANRRDARKLVENRIRAREASD